MAAFPEFAEQVSQNTFKVHVAIDFGTDGVGLLFDSFHCQMYKLHQLRCEIT